jgi:hypothetical protein
MINKAIGFEAKHYRYQYKNQSEHKTNQHRDFGKKKWKLFEELFKNRTILESNQPLKDIYYRRLVLHIIILTKSL